MPRKAQTSTRSRSATSRKKSDRKYSFEMLMLPYAVIVLAIILGGVGMWAQNRQFKQTIPQDTYQAVFLTSGQVYFGKLSPLNRQYMKLDDVYYLQSSVSQAEEVIDEETGETTVIEPTTEFSVFRLGEAEIHQPTNEMTLNRDHIVMWENMELDSQVIEAINREKAGE